MTPDDFALLIQKDLSRMATKADLAPFVTKEDLWPMQRDIKTLTSQLKEVREDVKQISDVMVSKADLANTLGEELAKSTHARQLHDLQTRVHLLEEKLKIKPAHRTARRMERLRSRLEGIEQAGTLAICRTWIWNRISHILSCHNEHDRQSSECRGGSVS